MSWNGSNQQSRPKSFANKRSSHGGSTRPQTPPSRSLRLGFFAGLIVVVLGGAVLWWFVGRGRSPSVPTVGSRVPRDRTIAEAVPQIATNRVAETKVAAKPQKTPNPPVFANEESRLAYERRRAHEIMWAKKLKTDKRLINYMKNFKPAKRDFGTGTEQMLDWIFNSKVGDAPPPPIPPLSEFELDHIDEILDSVNEINETDSAELAERKAMVDEVKKDLKAYLAQGGTVREFLDHYYKELQKAWESKCSARRSVEQVMGEGDADLSKQYLEKVNKLLEEQGIPAIELTEEEKEILEK